MRTLLVGFLLVLAGLPRLQARPIIVRLDVEQADASPSLIGYRLATTRDGENTRYTVELSADASAAFMSAVLFYQHPAQPPPVIPVETHTAPKSKAVHRLTFTIPTAALSDWALEIHGGPLRSQDRRLFNFYGYRLRLDNIPPPKA